MSNSFDNDNIYSLTNHTYTNTIIILTMSLPRGSLISINDNLMAPYTHAANIASKMEIVMSPSNISESLYVDSNFLLVSFHVH